MQPIIQMFGLPFIACVMMVMILGHLGIHVLKREVIFIDIALAQTAAVGSIIAHLVFGVHGDSLTAYVSAYGFVLLVSGFYALVRNRVVQIPLEAVIGVSYAIAGAGALFLVGTAPGGHVHIQEMLVHTRVEPVAVTTCKSSSMNGHYNRKGSAARRNADYCLQVPSGEGPCRMFFPEYPPAFFLGISRCMDQYSGQQ